MANSCFFWKQFRKFCIYTYLGMLVYSLAFPQARTSESSQKKIQAINQQIEELDKKLQNFKTEKSSTLNNIYEFELKSEKTIIERNKIEILMLEVQKKITQKEKEKEKFTKNIEASKADVKKILQTLYKVPGNLYMLFFFKLKDSNQLFRNYGLFKSLVNYQLSEINKIKFSISQLETIRSKLKHEYQNLSILKKKQEQKLQDLANLKRNKMDLINKINSDKKKYLELRDELSWEADRLQNLISDPSITVGLKILETQSLKGSLPWPLKGRVISTFGKKKSTQFNTYIFNNGIEIQPTVADDIQAIFAGKIAYSDYFKGYGNLIILQHSKNLYSLYGHCERFLKQKGDIVSAGETIAVVGDTGSTNGKSLYFEIRSDLKPEDPLNWLKKR